MLVRRQTPWRRSTWLRYWLRSPRISDLFSMCLSELGYSFEAGGEPFVDTEDSLVLSRIIESGANVSALHAEDGEIDLMTSICGFSFAELAEDAAVFEVAGSAIRVGRLEKRLRSKEMSGRPKDVEFLRAFRAREEEEE